MKTIQFFLLFTAYCLLPTSSIAQEEKAPPQLTGGLLIGSSNYLGEMGGKDKDARAHIIDLQMPKTRYAIGAFFRYQTHPLYAFRGNLFYGRLTGDDALSNITGRRTRNLQFRTHILELSVVAELEMIQLISNLKSGGAVRNFLGAKYTAFSVFLYAGVGLFHFEPKAELIRGSKDWIKLRPLATEGQGVVKDEKGKDTKKYKPIQLAIPIGLQVTYSRNQALRFGLEIGTRWTSTDYLDDASTLYPDPSVFNGDATAIALSNRSVEYIKDNPPTENDQDILDMHQPGSIRGNPKNHDFYFFTTFVVSYNLKFLFKAGGFRRPRIQKSAQFNFSITKKRKKRNISKKR